MPGDRMLGTLLRSLQTYTEAQDTARLLGTASSLLTTLNNPLNVTLLTSQLISAPAIWNYPEGLRTSLRALSVFHSAAQALIRHEVALKDKSADNEFSEVQLERTLPKDEWIRAVINGADDHSPRWRHLLVLGGLLLGFASMEEQHLSRSMRGTLESALMTAANLALEQGADDELAEQSITLVLNHCFPYLANHERAVLNYDLLLPVLMHSTLHSADGLRSGYFLGAIDLDVRPVSNSQFEWSRRSSSFQQVQKMLESPLLSSLGPLSRLIGHSVEQVKQTRLITSVLEDLETFSKALHLQWRQNKLSEVDASEESVFLDKETLDHTNPRLWKLLRSTLFAVVIVLRSVVGRILSDGAFTTPEGTVTLPTERDWIIETNDLSVAPDLASRAALETLRNLYFISARQGSASLSQYTFVYLAAIDILTAYPVSAAAWILAVRPTDYSCVPQHPLDRNLDLFFLNTAEHFTLTLPTHTSEELLIPAASPYLAAGGDNNLLPIFEAAHSVMLAVFSAPQNADLTARFLPFYIETLFNVFPHNLTARQFRLAFKTLLRLTSPPAILAATEPMLSATLLELLHERARHATTTPLFPLPSQENAETPGVPQLSELAVLTLTVIDTLTQLPLDLLDEWLPLAAEMMNSIDDETMREHCKEHFWHVLVGGEMDPDRSGVCHAWWSTDGGREIVLFGRQNEEDAKISMSGALQDGAKDSKL